MEQEFGSDWELADRSVRPTHKPYAAWPRQSPISRRPSPTACSNSLTLWRECSNSWMSAQTSACQDRSWVADSPQLAQRVWNVTPDFGVEGVSGSSMKTQRTSSISSFGPRMCS